ncbi:MAG: hypothetical protein ACPG8W_03355 [Candidatus Promineifilaceae bacterium]
MEVYRNDAKIKRYKTIAQGASLLGLSVLGVGLYLSFQGDPEMATIQLVTLLVGILLWQVSLYFSNTYVNSPRPDELLDDALRAASYKSHVYHYSLPLNHVMLTRSGPVAFVIKNQSGKISVSGDKGDRWKRSGMNLRRFLGQEPALGNPTREASVAIGELVKFIKEKAPEIDEIPIGSIIIFTDPQVKATLNITESGMPALHISDLKAYIRKQLGRPLPPEKYRRLRTIFEEASVEAGAVKVE